MGLSKVIRGFLECSKIRGRTNLLLGGSWDLVSKGPLKNGLLGFL